MHKFKVGDKVVFKNRKRPEIFTIKSYNYMFDFFTIHDKEDLYVTACFMEDIELYNPCGDILQNIINED